MGLVEAIVLGAVQGLTEFLPISSTAHLRVVPALVGWNDPGAAFSAVLQLGTTAAVVFYFRNELLRLVRAFARAVVKGNPLETVDSRLLSFVLLGTLPIGGLGLLLKRTIETTWRSLYWVSGALVALALVLWLAERLAKHDRSATEMTVRDALIIGAWQALALIPGASRSGTTLTGGLVLGFRREDAARYSFLLSIPATLLAGVFELEHLVRAQVKPSGGVLLTGMGVAFVTGLLAIEGLLRFLRTRTTLVFVAYRVLVGAGIFVLLHTGVIDALR